MGKAKIYGIKNCDTMKKAFKWLDENDIDYHFHDYKKSGTEDAVLKSAINEYGWENVLNRRGTTWRQLPDTLKNTMDNYTAIKVAEENPSIIKRPLLERNNKIVLGFNSDEYHTIFKQKS